MIRIFSIVVILLNDVRRYPVNFCGLIHLEWRSGSGGFLISLFFHFRSQEGVKYQAWRTTPFDVAATISRGLADSASVARVTYSSYVSDYDLGEDGMDAVDTLAESMAELDVGDGEGEEKSSNMTMLWDMTRPLVGNVSKLEFLKFDADQDARTVFWHSSAHILGEALEHLYGSRLTIGPPLAGGFYYDSYMGSGSDGAFNEDDCEFILVHCVCGQWLMACAHVVHHLLRLTRRGRGAENRQGETKV